MTTVNRCARRRSRRAADLVLPLLAALLLAPAAFAQYWTEVGEAGDLVGNAQVTVGSGPLTIIGGMLAAHGDVDVYCLQLTATPPAGLPLAWINCTMMADPSLYLFSPAGLGITANMTCSGGLKQLVAPNVSLAPGLYYLAIAHYDWMPVSAGGDIWQQSFTGPLLPNGPGAGSPLTGWMGPSTVVSPNVYTISTNQNFFNYCELATTDESTTWGSLKARYGR